MRLAGHRVDVADSGRGAMERMRAHHYDVVVSDLMMPDFGGLELLSRLRAMGRGEPFVFLTGSPDVESAMEAVRLGAVRYGA